jgi:hypothetical protein
VENSLVLKVGAVDFAGWFYPAIEKKTIPIPDYGKKT